MIETRAGRVSIISACCAESFFQSPLEPGPPARRGPEPVRLLGVGNIVRWKKWHLLLDASLRDMTSGYKAVLATLAQPFFRRKGGGTKVPIRIAGTRAKPQFGMDVKKAFLPGQ